MFLFLAFLLIVELWFEIRALRGRWELADEELRRLRTRHDDLSAELSALEKRTAAPPPPPAPVATPVRVPAPPPLPVIAKPAPPPLPQPPPEPWVPRQMTAAEPDPEPEPTPEPTPQPEPEPRDWESLIGGNLLNKIGSLALVIGLAFLLSYSFANMGPLGRSLTGIVASLALIGGGVWVERKEQYRVFARGVLAAGWASLYFTAYAMHALEAARVVENPVVGLVMMLAVAAGIVWHSLQYRVQALTALAYGCAFAALALTPLSMLAAAALVPLALSMLYLARRFRWYSMALFGSAATYATFLSHGPTSATLVSIQGMLVIFWVLFEAFDLLRIFEKREADLTDDAQFAVNALAGLGTSAFAWYRLAPDSMWIFATGASLLYLASTCVRVWLGGRSRYQASLAISTVLGGLAIVAHVQGIWVSLGLTMLAEALFLAGQSPRLGFARWLSLPVFLWSTLFALSTDGSTRVLGRDLRNWTPPLLLEALVFYGNRYLDRGASYFSYVASAFVAAVLGKELSPNHVAAGWFGLAALLSEIGFRRKLEEFRYQGCAAMLLAVLAVAAFPFETPTWVLAFGTALAWSFAFRSEIPLVRHAGSAITAGLGAFLITRLAPEAYWGIALLAASSVLAEAGLRGWPVEMRWPALVMNLASLAALRFLYWDQIHKDPLPSVTFSFAAAAVLYYAWAARLRRVGDGLASVLSRISIAAAAPFALTTAWMLLPDPWVPLVFSMLAVAAIEIVLLLGAPDLAWHGRGLSLFAVAFFAYLCSNGVEQGRLANGILIVAVQAYFWFRSKDEILAPAHGWIAAGAAASVAPIEWPAHYLVGWSGIGVLLAAGARGLKQKHLGWQAGVLALALFFVAAIGGAPAPQRALAIAFLAAAFLLEDRAQSGLRQGYALLSALLTAITLFREASGGMLTLSWGLEGIVLLAAGFLAAERVLRLSGLALLLGCIGKLFVYDLRNLDTIYRILSFIGLGLILLAVSWFYARFKERLEKFL